MPQTQSTATTASPWYQEISIYGLAQLAALGTFFFSFFTLFTRTHRYIELFSPFRLQYSLASLLLLLVFVILKKKLWVALCAACLLLNSF